MLQLSRSRMSVPVAAVVALLAFAAPALAMPPEVTLTAPSGRQAANPPAFTGTAGTHEWESGEIAVDIWAGDKVGDKPLQVGNATLNRETGAFSGTLATALADGTYTARARQRNSEQETGYSDPLVFQIGAPPAEATPTPTPTPEATPAPVAAVATPAPTVTPAVQPDPPYKCRSRRDFTKHVFRPAGTKLRVVATVNGRTLKSVITREQILIRIDLRGQPKDTYTLRVAITRTRPDGKRIKTVAVEQIDYHTCIPTAKPSY
jgi:hypothetical protein